MSKKALALLIIFISANAGAMPYSQKPNGQFLSPYKGNMLTRNMSKEEQEEDRYKKTLEQSKNLEGVLISKMIDPMFPEGKESGLYGGGAGSDIYRAMMIQEYGKILSKGEGLGLAGNIADKLTK